MQQNITDLKNNHNSSLKGILHGYPLKDIFRSVPFWLSLVLTFLILLLTYISKKDSLEILKYWIGQNLSIFPNFLGFSLGGYALIVGFGNTALIQSITKMTTSTKASVFQKLNSIFAFSLLAQLAAFLVSLGVNYFIQLDFKAVNETSYIVVNLSTLFVAAFLSIWCVLIIPYIVLGIFNFGQMHHLHLTINRLKDENRSNLTN